MRGGRPDAGSGQGVFFRLLPSSGMQIGPRALRLFELQAQLAEALIGAELDFADPARHLVGVALPGVGRERGRLVPDLGDLIDARALGERGARLFVADQRRHRISSAKICKAAAGSRGPRLPSPGRVVC
jgi:hypothetical protein